MKKYRRFSLIFVAVLIVIFTAAEMILISGTDKKENERPYRVEINRVVNELRRENQVPEDLSLYRYITKIEKLPEEDFGLIESDYVTVRINGGNYRISYEHQREADYSAAAAAAVIFSLVLVLITVLLVYIGNRIISPFHRLRELPYELSKGNLVKPLEESKNRFFGKFLWGVELLGKKLREEKAKELELQKEKNTLMLSLSHDIKTPLSAIKLYSKALSRGLYTDPEKQLEISENIGAKADEIESFLEQIINAAKEDFLSFDVKDGEVYLSDLTESIHSY